MGYTSPRPVFMGVVIAQFGGDPQTSSRLNSNLAKYFRSWSESFVDDRFWREAEKRKAAGAGLWRTAPT